MNTEHVNTPPTDHVKVLGDQGWVGLVDQMGSEISIVNAARVSFGKIRSEMNERDEKLLEYLISCGHTSTLEHVVFTFLVHCPLFVRSQWHRHRTWSYNEISRRYTEIDLQFYVPPEIREQAESNRQASVEAKELDQEELQAIIREQNEMALECYEELLKRGVCREQARGVLPQNMFTTFWATVDMNNLIHFLKLRDHDHAQWEIRQYAQGIKQLIKPFFPNVASILEW